MFRFDTTAPTLPANYLPMNHNEPASSDQKLRPQKVAWCIFKLALFVLLMIGLIVAVREKSKPLGQRDFGLLQWCALPILLVTVIEGLVTGETASRTQPNGVSR